MFQTVSSASRYGVVPLVALALAAPVSLGLPPGNLTLARQSLAGPVHAVVEQVVDGDTLQARALIWLGQEVIVRVRLRGVDAPEARSDCAAERAAAEAAAAFLSQRLAGRTVRLTNIAHDKFGGRVLADVADDAGASIAAELIARGLARAYGGAARRPWC